jgi:sortase (surface protein transpeptidase)
VKGAQAGHGSTRARHRRSPERRPIARSAGIALVVCGLLATGLGLGGWALNQGVSERLVSHGAHRGVKGFAAEAPGPVGLISGPAKRPSRIAKPEWLVIPAIGVFTNLVRLGLSGPGTLQVPPTAAVAGWYTGSPRPGQIGSSIIAGHVDSRLGPGVFYRLSQMRRGEYVYVIRANHTVAVFEVTSLRAYAKSRFPAKAVYGPVPDAELRLITCGGTFDFATGSYLSNIVVYATLISRSSPAPRVASGRPRI